MSTASLTERFDRATREVRWAGLDNDVRQRLTWRLADLVGLIAAAQATPAGRATIAAARREPGDRPLLFDGTSVSGGTAAFAHGTLAHVLDFDDTLPDSVIHPTSVVLPAALAAAEDTARVTDVLAAALPGYELLARVGAMAGRSFHARGFQATSVLGPIAAALTACRVRGEPPDVCVSAMGLAGSMSSGLLEFLSDGSWSKRMHPGWAAQGGLRAADLAAAGFPGPARILEGRHGIFRSFIDSELDQSQEEVFSSVGTDWHSQATHWKFIPCAHVIHPFVAMVRHLVGREGLRAEDVAHLRCFVAPWYVPIVCEPRDEKIDPSSEYQARASLPYVLGLELTGIGLRPDAFEHPTRDREDLRNVVERIEHVADASLTSGFGARIEVTTMDGHQRTLTPQDLPEPVDESIQLRQKFDENLAVIGRADLSSRLWGLLQDPGDTSVGDVITTTLPPS